MRDFTFSRARTEQLVGRIKRYFIEELDHEIGSFEAEFLIDFFAKEIGPHCYNQGLSDANTLFLQKCEEIGYLLQEQEKPTP